MLPKRARRHQEKPCWRLNLPCPRYRFRKPSFSQAIGAVKVRLSQLTY